MAKYKGYGYGTGGNGANSGPAGCSGAGGAGGGSSAVFDSTTATLFVAAGGSGGGGGGGYNQIPEAGGGGGQNGNFNASAGERVATAGGNTTRNGAAGGSTTSDGGGGGGGGGGATNGGLGGSAPNCDCGAGAGGGGNNVGNIVMDGNAGAPGDSTDAGLCAGCARGGAGAIQYNNYTAPPGGNGIIIITPVNGGTVFTAQVTPADTAVCRGSKVAIHATGGTAYLWNPAASLDSATTPDPVAGPDSTTTYLVAIKLGACVDTASVVVTVIQGAKGIAGTIIPPLDTICTGSNVQLIDTGSSGTIRWQSSQDGILFSDIPGASSDTLVNPSNSQLTYYRVQANGGCSAMVPPVAATVVVSPVPVVSVTTGNGVICAGDSARLCATGGFSLYEWNEGASGSGNCAEAEQQGSYDVTVTDAHSCTAVSNQVAVTVNPVPRVVLTSDKDIFCSGDSAQLCATAGFPSYQWNTGVSGTGNCIEVEDAGNYYVTVTDHNNCTAESNHLPMRVYPVPSVSILEKGNTFFSFGQVSYQWYLNGNPVDSATSPEYIANQAGSYTVQVTDSNGCTAISTPLAVTGLNELMDGEDVFIYPNPSAGNWQLAVSNGLIGSALEVYDQQGQLVWKDEIRSAKYDIGDATLSTGVFFMRI